MSASQLRKFMNLMENQVHTISESNSFSGMVYCDTHNGYGPDHVDVVSDEINRKVLDIVIQFHEKIGAEMRDDPEDLWDDIESDGMFNIHSDAMNYQFVLTIEETKWDGPILCFGIIEAYKYGSFGSPVADLTKLIIQAVKPMVGAKEFMILVSSDVNHNWDTIVKRWGAKFFDSRSHHLDQQDSQNMQAGDLTWPQYVEYMETGNLPSEDTNDE